MTARTMLRWGTIVLAVAALVLLARGAGIRWDPFDLEGRRLEQVKAELRAARAEVAARREEVEAERLNHQRIQTYQRRSAALERDVAVVIEQAKGARDAQDELGLERAARLHDHDQRLCDVAPDLGGCAAPSDPGGAGDTALRTGAAAAGPDQG